MNPPPLPQVRVSRAIDLPVTPRRESWPVLGKRERRAIRRARAKAKKKKNGRT